MSDNIRSTREQPLLLEILPGTLFFSQFMQNPVAKQQTEGNDSSGTPEGPTTDQIISREGGQIKFRSNAPKNWLQCLGIPNPTSVKWDGEVISHIEKNAKGDIFLEYVNKKRVVTVSWDFLTQKQYDKLLNQLRIDFRNPRQNFLYYRIRTVNPNGDWQVRDTVNGSDTGMNVCSECKKDYEGYTTDGSETDENSCCECKKNYEEGNAFDGNSTGTNDNREPQRTVSNSVPQISTMITYLDGKHTAEVAVYTENDKMLIGYKGVSLTFIER